ncbi:MAG: ANTAR domain-containing protein [Oscillospiraceae bacterium]|nr:ANTAR domain-containing protein [Oscillospiraceae bacterium]
MAQKDKVIVAFEGEKSAWRIKEILESMGTVSCIMCRTADQVRRVVNKQRIYAVVCGYKLPDASAEELFGDLPDTCPMLLIATQAMLDLCGNRDIFPLPAPVSKGMLIASVHMLLQMEHRMEQYIHPQRKEEEEHLIRQAKELLMCRHGMTEEDAHYHLQKQSMDRGVRMVQTAQMILNDA